MQNCEGKIQGNCKNCGGCKPPSKARHPWRWMYSALPLAALLSGLWLGSRRGDGAAIACGLGAAIVSLITLWLCQKILYKWRNKKMSIQVGTTENFDAAINGELPVLADFWASWCGPCRMLMPMVEALAEEYAGKLAVLKINVDDEPALAARYSVTTIPTLILFKGGQALDRSVGARPKHLLQALVEKAL